jgi:hypothetical protein
MATEIKLNKLLLFYFFNRLGTTVMVFETIRQAKPKI